MQPDTRILIITNHQQDLDDLRNVLSGNGNKPEILVARTHDGGLEMARQRRPHLCILGPEMMTVNGRSFSNTLQEACPETDIFIVEHGELGRVTRASA